MIALLDGQVIRRDPDSSILLTRSGVGYEVRVPGQIVIEKMVGGMVFLAIWHVIREADQLLYGFRDIDDRDLAILIAGTAGVGPAKASALVHAAGSGPIVQAVRTGDAGGLPKVKGLSAAGIESILAYLKTQKLPSSTDSRIATVLQIFRQVSGDPDQRTIAAVERFAKQDADAGPQLLFSRVQASLQG